VPALLKGFFSIKWVADFRDGWTAAPYHEKRKGFENRLKRLLEAFVLKRCDKVIANTNGNKRALLDTFDFLGDGKVTVITNGFDTREPLEDIEIRKEETDCDIMHVGAVYPAVVDLLVYSLSSIKKRHPERLPRILVYGQMSNEDLLRLREAGLENNVLYKGWVPWDKSIHLMKKARSLVLLLPHTKGGSATVPSKLYTYLFSGRPVMLIGPSGDASSLVETVGVGVAIKDEDPDKIADGILSFLDALGRGDYARQADENRLRPYTMEAVVNRLNRMLIDDVLPNERKPPE
jgi:glycosyltransferase involved in cell wall biosynthesis